MPADDAIVKANPWQPEPDPVIRQILGKLCEECGELISAASRCSIQGVREREPVTLIGNRDWLEDEVADVLAAIQVLGDLVRLDQQRIQKRKYKKIDHFRQWFAQIVQPQIVKQK